MFLLKAFEGISRVPNYWIVLVSCPENGEINTKERFEGPDEAYSYHKNTLKVFRHAVEQNLWQAHSSSSFGIGNIPLFNQSLIQYPNHPGTPGWLALALEHCMTMK